MTTTEINKAIAEADAAMLAAERQLKSADLKVAEARAKIAALLVAAGVTGVTGGKHGDQN